MTASRIARVGAALALAAALIGAPTAAHASTSCLEPRADAPTGATFTITSGTVQSGGPVTFSGTGFTRSDTDGLGQTLAFKLNDQVQWSQTVKAGDDGTVSGSLSLGDLAAADVTDIVAKACGKTWVRVLVGSSAAGDMAPSRSLHATFELAATPGGATPTPISTAPGQAGGQLPQTGNEDAAPLAWIAGLAGVAAVALVAERFARRRGASAKV